MADVFRIRADWSGFVGSPGYSNFHFLTNGIATVEAAQPYVNAVRTFFDSIKAYLPLVVRVTVHNEVEVVNTITGDLRSVLTLPAVAAVQGTGTGGYSAASGVCISWSSQQIRNGRRMRGRTFLVPTAASTMDPDGTINGAALTNLQTAVNALVATPGSDFVIYGRPTFGNADGQTGEIISGRISDKVAVLRSRRD